MLPLAKALQLVVIACTGVSTFYVAAHWASGRRDGNGVLAEVVTPVVASRAAATPDATEAGPPAPDADLSVSAAERLRSLPKSGGDAFASLSWLPPPPPPPPPAAPAPAPPPPKPVAPTAPPLPFVFIGMLERDTEKTKAFLAKGDALYVVSVGDVLDNNTYRIDSLTPSEMVVTYLPLNAQQKLNVSGDSK
jgi:hypothetical protein